ncbi:GYD domain-containing protein [Saccharopolyspora spinosporotrichia]
MGTGPRLEVAARRIGGAMPKYLVQGSYTAEGTKGVLAEGGTGRREAVERVLSSCGGSLESMYFAFGPDDFHIVVDMPDDVSMAATAMAVRATGAVTSRAVQLLRPEEIDEAARKNLDFRAPGA